MKYITLILLACMVGTLNSCSYLRRIFFKQETATRSEQKKKDLPPLYLGTVHQVYAGQHFALLRIIGPTPRPGATLISHPQDGTNSRLGNLVVTDDTPPRRGIIVADIRSGEVAGGDFVYLYRSISQQEDVMERPIDISAPTSNEQAPDMPLNVRTRPVQTPGTDNSPTNKLIEQALSEPGAQEGSGSPASSVETQRPRQQQPHMPKLPDRAPSYLDSIPDDINQWD